MNSTYLSTDDNGIVRCSWGASPADYRAYHDSEWGLPTVDDDKLFEKICLEGFQAGLSWYLILQKRDNFRAAFAHFDFYQVAHYDDKRVIQLLNNAGIVRHRQKIEATINNAARAIELVQEFGSLAAYIWQWEPAKREPHSGKGDYPHPVPGMTKTSQALSRDLKQRGWKFFGPTTAYAFMQAMGLVNDHLPACHRYPHIEQARARLIRPRTSHIDSNHMPAIRGIRR